MKYIVDIDDFEPLFKVDSIGVFGIGKSVTDSDNNHSWSRIKSVEEFEELNSDYINEHYGDLQDEAYQRGYDDATKMIASDEQSIADKAYQRGLNDAWECAKKLFSTMSDTEIEKVFPVEWKSGFSGLMQMKPQYAMAKIKAYEEKQNDKIEVGDTVDLKDAVSDKGGGIVTKIFDNDCCYIVWYDGSGGAWAKDTLVKTGKHIDIASILREINDEP